MAITNPGMYFTVEEGINTIPYFYNVTVLAGGIVEFAAKDLRKAIKRDIKKKYYNSMASSPEYMTDSIVRFFGSSLCDTCCGRLDPWYIVYNILREFDNRKLPYGYLDSMKNSYLKERNKWNNERKCYRA